LIAGPPECIEYFKKMTIQLRDAVVNPRYECDLEGALTAR